MKTKIEWTGVKEDILIDLWRQLACLYEKPNLNILLFAGVPAGADITGADITGAG